MSNLHKSEAGWARYRERTNSGLEARRASMEARPHVAKARREKLAVKPPQPTAPRYFRRSDGVVVEI